MAGPVTHVLVPMILLEVYRRYISKKSFPYWMVLLGGLFGALPDFDIVIGYGWNALTGHHTWMHRMFSHSLLLVLMSLAAGLVFYLGYRNRWWKRKKWITYTYTILFIASFAVFTHVMLDCINGFQYIFWPLSFSCSCPNWIPDPKTAMVLDGVMLVLWLLLDERVFNPVLKWVNRKLGK